MKKFLSLFMSCLFATIVMTVDVTAYTPHENGSSISAIGKRCVEGRTVALNGVPLGATVIYNGHVYTVEDRVGYNCVLDIFMESYDKAIQFGRRRNQTIEVIY